MHTHTETESAYSVVILYARTLTIVIELVQLTQYGFYDQFKHEHIYTSIIDAVAAAAAVATITAHTYIFLYMQQKHPLHAKPYVHCMFCV